MPYQKQNDKTIRQFKIIRRLYALEALKATKIALEYEVSSRTITRDMKLISTVIPLHKEQGLWSIDVETLQSFESPLNYTLLKSFANNVQMDIACFDLHGIQESKVNFAIEYNHLPKKLGEKIVSALQEECRCTFVYIKPHERSQRTVDPVKLYTENGRWYLVARDYKDDKVKTFLLSRIERFKLTEEDITLTQAMLDEAEEIKSVWASGFAQEVLVKLYVKPEALTYIVDVKLHHTQDIVEHHYDGGAVVHCTITHKLEILPAIKSWIPHIHILEPKWLWEEFMRDLEYYRDEDDRMDI